MIWYKREFLYLTLAKCIFGNVCMIQPRSQPGVSHLTAPWSARGSGKMRDPGNEVVYDILFSV